MKTLVKTMLTVLILAASNGCKENQSVEVNTPAEVKQEEKTTADIADQEFIDGMTGAIWHHYLAMKMALTQSDADQVQQSAGNIAEIFTEERVKMKEFAQLISETDNIEVQRELFAQLTEEIGPLFEDALSGGTIYKKFCPMALDNKGAFWYADVEKITNPYFGEKMLHCGSIEKTISK